jgi:site-specific recombinase XerD
MRHIHDLDPQDVIAAVEVLPRKYALVCMETNSNANLTPVRQVVEHFLVAKQLEGCAKDTIRFYRENLVRFLWWGERNALPDEVSKIDVQRLRDFLYYVQTAKERFGGRSVSARRLASPSTVDAYWRTLQSLFAWLVREGIVAPDKNPMVRIPRPRVPEKVTQDIPLVLISKVLESYDNSSFLSVRNRAIILVTCATPTPHLC